MTQARIGFQTFLQRGDGGAPENFTSLIEILSLKGPSQKVDMKDATNMSSPGNVGAPIKEFIRGAEDSGEVQVDVNWVPGDAQHAGILTDKANGTARNWRIAFPAGFSKSFFQFTGYVSGFEPTYPVDDKITVTVTIKVTGALTLS